MLALLSTPPVFIGARWSTAFGKLFFGFLSFLIGITSLLVDLHLDVDIVPCQDTAVAPRNLRVPSRRGHWKGDSPSFPFFQTFSTRSRRSTFAGLSIEDGTGELVSWGGILFSVARNTMMQIGMTDMAGQGISQWHTAKNGNPLQNWRDVFAL